MAKELGAHITVKCETQMCSVRIYDKDDRQLYYKERDPEFEYSFTTQSDGAIKVCLMNYANTYTRTEIGIRSGVDAKNYDTLVTQKNLKPIELQAQKIQDFARELKRTMKHSLRAERLLKREVNESSASLNTTSYTSIIVMMVATLMSVLILRTYFNKKKKM
mmetsp:Transcript_22964/g.25492  ORF Transcript_22964/g.25492 Transcript_22964/m.25492 type:complete len:162 (-) Transcript_22964:49-534(-)